ncbi:MAG: metal-dependent hydrolase, partial [Candidatus Acidiferrales bacterium]
VATFAAVGGAMFPDIDIVRYAFSSDPLAIVKYHRAITHSFIALPFFAVALAWLTRALFPFVQRKIPKLADLESPSFATLTLIYAVGLASHILLDGMTSWDILFIIDFVFTSLVLVPQIVAWIFAKKEKSRVRGIAMWTVFTVASVGAWFIARNVGFPFHLWIVALASAIFALVFFAPAIRGWGFTLGTPAWCQNGAFLTLLYLFVATYAHHVAIHRVAAFSSAQGVTANRQAAIPLPPSLLDWGGEVRSPNGVYQSRFDLRDPDPPPFHFVPDSPPSDYVMRAMQLPEVQLYWQFARFPVIRTSSQPGVHVVDFNENRFIARQNPDKGPTPFSYRVVFDDSGNVIEEGWQADGLNVRRMSRILPPHGKELK